MTDAGHIGKHHTCHALSKKMGISINHLLHSLCYCFEMKTERVLQNDLIFLLLVPVIANISPLLNEQRMSVKLP
jgi:uncharacterized membrane protein (DUF373 family)